VKACPFCAAEIRDSVIRCTRCGRSLLPGADLDEEREPARASTPSGLGAPVVSPRSRGTSVGFPQGALPFPSSDTTVWAPPSPASAGATPPSAPAIAPPGVPLPNNLTARRALPSERRSGHPDLALLLAALATMAVAVLAWKAIDHPWVRLVITDTSDRLDPKLVGDITLRGHAALVGVLGRGLAVVLGALGAAWFLYGFDKGSTMRWFVNPAIAIVASIVGMLGVVLSALVWFVWEDAAVEHARAVRLTTEELATILDHQPAPLVEIQRLAGLMRFGGAMLIGLLSASLAWWAYRRRS
jgi:hypothetical protein